MVEPRNNNGPFRIDKNTSNTLTIVGPVGKVSLPTEKLERDFASSLGKFYEKFLSIFQHINEQIKVVARIHSAIPGLTYRALKGLETGQQDIQNKSNFQRL